MRLSWDDLKNIIYQSTELGAWIYAFTGGEPLLLKERLFRYAETVLKLNPKAKLILETNGTLIHMFKPKMFEVFNNVQISLDGFEKTNNVIRGNFSRVLNNALKLKEYEIPITINITVSRLNYLELSSFRFPKEYGF